MVEKEAKEDNSVHFKKDDTIFNGRFKIMEYFGKGGFGQVYKVKDTKSTKYYALKLQVKRPDRGNA